MRPRVFIFGSYITAMVMETPRLPHAGETLAGHGFRQTHGGKGSNMAVQAARLGAAVTFAGVVGRDASGDAFVATLVAEGVATDAVRKCDGAPTGTGFIVVDAAGRNLIVIDPGANADFTPANDFERLRPRLAGCGAALAVLEIPRSTALEGLAAAKRAGPRTILNPAPACDLTGIDLSAVDYITPNETEARLCLGRAPDEAASESELAEGLLALDIRAVVFTRGEHGALLVARDRRIEQPAFPVRVVDTVGAGDSFNAAFAVALAEGRDEAAALRFACAAASLSTTRRDTLASHHRRDEVDSALMTRPTSDAYRFDPSANIILAPSDLSLWPAYRAQLAAWRDEIRTQVRYDDSLYAKPEFAWSAASYVCYFVMMYDEAFYDAATGRYTVDALLDGIDEQFGGCDSVVLWHAYPRIGVDQRNQFDFYRDMPGGLAGLRAAVAAFHARGVRVYINYNPWDRATRREAKPDADMLAEFIGALDADGIFLDTMARGDFREKLDAVRPGVVLEGENSPSSENVYDHHASWAQWFDDSDAPGVLRHKWMERRHMQHQTQRWNSDHTAELHTAWMNGTGMMLWENVFGAWVPWNARDRSLLRAMTPIQRRYTSLFSGEGWTPLVPVEQPNVYASLWAGDDVRLWTLVNRSDRAIDGRLLAIDARPGDRHFDLIAGREIEAADATLIAARGIGCLIALPAGRVDADFEAFLAKQAATHALFDGDTTRPYRDVRVKPVAPTRPYSAAPVGMIAAEYNHWTESLATQIRARECGLYDPNVSDAAGYRYSYHFRVSEFDRPLKFAPYAFDATPVTNAQFAEFLALSDYLPNDAARFLDHWIDGAPPADKLDHPVVWVDLADARAYAAWAGKRLPTESEWQYAAQNSDGREYPWGNGLRAGVCNLGQTGDTTPVTAFPNGRTPWGGYDFCGNVWQWTESEATEGRTRFCMIRGGSYFAPVGTNWYVEGGPRAASYATKFLMMSPSLDRCATVGFRCVVDLQR